MPQVMTTIISGLDYRNADLMPPSAVQSLTLDFSELSSGPCKAKTLWNHCTSIN